MTDEQEQAQDAVAERLERQPTLRQVDQRLARSKKRLQEAAEDVVWLVENRAWEVKGYTSWKEMREAEYGDAAFMLPTAERPAATARLVEAGLSNREAARTAGVSHVQVQRDVEHMYHSDASDKGVIDAREGVHGAREVDGTPSITSVGEEPPESIAPTIDDPGEGDVEASERSEREANRLQEVLNLPAILGTAVEHAERAVTAVAGVDRLDHPRMREMAEMQFKAFIRLGQAGLDLLETGGVSDDRLREEFSDR